MATQALTLKQYIDNPTITDGLERLLGKNAQAFKSNLLNIVSGNSMLENCNPKSIVGAAVCAAVNNLSLTPGLGFNPTCTQDAPIRRSSRRKDLRRRADGL